MDLFVYNRVMKHSSAVYTKIELYFGTIDSSEWTLEIAKIANSHIVHRPYAYERTLNQRCAVIYFITRQSDVIVIYTQKLSNFT